MWMMQTREGVLNFHFGIGMRPERRKWGLKERVGTKNRGLKNWFVGKNRA